VQSNLAWGLTKPVSTFALHFNDPLELTIHPNRPLLGAGGRVRVYSEPVSNPNRAPLPPVSQVTGSGTQAHLRTAHEVRRLLQHAPLADERSARRYSRRRLVRKRLAQQRHRLARVGLQFNRVFS
jgi:hypothetical protein